jgi:RNA polymerase primary sigma factor
MSGKAAEGPREGLSVYLRDVGKTRPLSREEEQRLGRRIQSGDIESRNDLVTANLRFGVAMAKTYQGRGLSLDELISAANVGLIEAAARYDPRYEARFITYASWWIRRFVLRALDSHNKLVHLPAHVQDLIRKVQWTAKELREELERSPTVHEIGARCEEPEGRVRMALENIHAFKSLDRDLGGTADQERRLAHELHDLGSEPSSALDLLAVDDQVVSLLSELSDRESSVIRRYFGFDGVGEGNLAEIGRSMELSRERVRQIKSTALRRLRRIASKEDSLFSVSKRGDDGFHRPRSSPILRPVSV